ncbi:MAG: DUF1573 domain-containing protein [Gemmataceae bacterium]
MVGEVRFVEPHLNLGTARLNETIGGAFTIVNETDRTVTLLDPFKSWSCTDARVDRRTLGPGEQCALKVSVNTGTKRGKRAETVSMIVTDPDGSNQQQFVGRILFEVKGVFEVDPVQLTLTRAEPRASFTVRGDPTADRHSVLDVKSNHRCVKVDASALPLVKLELDLTTPDESILNVDCTIYTNNPAEDTIRVPIRVRKE